MTEPAHPFHALILDATMAHLQPARRALLAHARGRVLEIGIGTGANLRHYAGIDALVGIEPDRHMLRRAESRRRARRDFPIDLLRAGAESLPLPDASFDTVVATWVLCTIPDPAAALREVRRVLRPTGTFLFVEHVQSRFPRERALQDALNPLWRRVAGGCNLNRDTGTVIREAGFAHVRAEPHGRETWTILPQLMGDARDDA